MRAPSPYWWFRKPRFDDARADDLLAALTGHVAARDDGIRLLNVGCYEGQLLEQLKDRTKWRLAGAETNERAVALARHKGFTVWETSAADAATTVPSAKSFNVIVLDAAEHLQDPLLVVRRLRQLLLPGGLIVLHTPNLDSAHATLFGPTWAHWQPPYHRVLMGRRALRRLAYLADLKLVATRTVTHAYPATVSAQLNELGLGAIVPDNARFPDEVSSKGVRLTGWSRLLWDWRGKGDFVYAVMKLL